jgi:sugar/nucleoside kinase (ribokinase family)
MNQEYDLLSIGDVSMDVFLQPSETDVLCNLNDKECVICFSYGDKIPVRNLEFSVGGNAANNVVGTKRLGIRSGLVSTLGGDTVGNQIVEYLEKEEVDLTYAIQQPMAGTNYSTVINYGGERTIFSYHAPRSYEFPVHLPKTKWVYLTSMGETFVPFYNHLLAWLREHPEVKVAFNPGSWQIRIEPAMLKLILARTEVIYVNRKEAEIITGFGPSQNKDKELLVALSKTGPKMVIITDGERGSYIYDGQKFLRCGVLPVDAYERTGAGDSFGSGCIAALVKEKPLDEALLWGTVNSASVIGYVGAQKGLLHEEDMRVWLDRAKSSDVVVSEF